MNQGAHALQRLDEGAWIGLGHSNLCQRFSQAQAGEKILYVGCGPAQVLSCWPEVDYVGIDLNEKHIAYAREHFGPRGRFIVGNAAEISIRRLSPST